MIPINLELLGFPISQSELTIDRGEPTRFSQLSNQTKHGQNLRDVARFMGTIGFLIIILVCRTNIVFFLRIFLSLNFYKNICILYNML